MLVLYGFILLCCYQNTKAMQFGQPADIANFKYKVLLYMDGNIDNYCQGALISSEWILTTARFLYKV